MNRNGVLLVVIVIAAALGLTTCSDGSDESIDAGSTQASATAAATTTTAPAPTSTTTTTTTAPPPPPSENDAPRTEVSRITGDISPKSVVASPPRPRVRPEHDVHPHRHRLPARRRARPPRSTTASTSPPSASPGTPASPRARPSRPPSPATAATPTCRTTRCTAPGSGPRATTRARRVGLRRLLHLPDRHRDVRDRPGHQGRRGAEVRRRHARRLARCSSRTGAPTTSA